MTMSSVRRQIISRLPTAADPHFVVLFDFELAFTVQEGTDFSPAPMRTNMVWSHQVDGQVMAASSWDDRELELHLGAMRGSAEDQAENIQTLGRLLGDPRGQWFLWQDDGMVHPRYFRTRRTSMQVQDLLLLEAPKRTLTMTIPAAPFAFGDEVVGNAIIKNDPTATPNPMSLVLPPIKGDVATPLTLTAAIPGSTVQVAVASMALPADAPFGPPLVLQLEAFTDKTNTAWTWSTASAAGFIGGSARRLVNNSTITGAVDLPVTVGYDVLANVRPGDYRVLLRAGGAVDPQEWSARIAVSDASGDAESGAPITEWTALEAQDFGTTGSSNRWFDLGIIRMPAAYPLANDPLASDIPDSPVDIELFIRATTGATGHLDLDAFMFVPVNLDEAIDNRWAQITHSLADGTDFSLIMDGAPNPQRVVPINTAGSVGMLNCTFVGSLPQVVPGASNMLHFVRQLWGAAWDAVITQDALTLTIPVTYTYRPRYVYGRSATA